MKINVTDYYHVSKIEFNGHMYKSSYNHNYYTNGVKLILEECDDADCFLYYHIVNNSREYLGCFYSLIGIFDNGTQTVFELNEN